MQPLNDDMDELYRKAAENYPLDTHGADWNKVMQQLHASEEEGPAVKKNNYRKYLWLLLLLPFVFICNRYSGVDNISPINNNTSEEKIQATKPDHNNEGHSTTIKEKQSRITTTIIQNETVTTNKRIENRQPLQENYLQSTNPSQTNSNKTYFRKGRNNTGSLISDAPEKRIAKNAMLQNEKKVDPKISDTRSNDNKIVSKNKEPQDHTTGIRNNKTTNDMAGENSSIPKKVATIQPPLNNKEADSSKIETKNSKVSKSAGSKKGFYAGVVLGPDYSTIKFQRIKSSGYSVGVLIGYQINNHLAVESGGLWDKKNYYSEGTYFNTRKIALPYNVKILEVTGSCYMIEIPLNVRYNFKTGKNGNWFVTAGTSSYLMKKEDYTYLYDHNNSTYDVYKAYKNSSRNWFSIMNISAGYEHSLNKNTLLRIEPYIKLPITGVGIGSLPITSTGLYISITRPVLK